MFKHKTDPLPYGYINCYGVQLTDADVREYNRISAFIESWQGAGYQAREIDLNARHMILSRKC